MNLKRRDLLTSLGGIAATAAISKLGAQLPSESTFSSLMESALGSSEFELRATSAMAGSLAAFPRKADFLIDEGYTYINAAYTHPIPKVSLEAARQAAERRGSLRAPAAAQAGGRATGRGAAGRGTARAANDPKSLFAELINANPREIAFVPSTSFGENMAVQALRLHKDFRGNVVSDGLHFEGSLKHLLELEKKGLEVRIVQPTKDARIDMKDMEKAVDRNTRLIEVSSAAMYNGFQHDLKAVSDLAHAHGAMVYADIIHSAGAEPFDIKATGVDFASCSSFKWLMGDFGIGFMYMSDKVWDKVDAPTIGYMDGGGASANYPPNLPDGPYTPVTYGPARGAGIFEPGTFGGSSVAAALMTASLGYIRELGVANIQAHRQPMLKKLREEVPRFGFTLVTPPESTGGNITFAKTNVGRGDLPARLNAAKVNIRFSTHWIRLSPSVYNDMSDIDRFLQALS